MLTIIFKAINKKIILTYVANLTVRSFLAYPYATLKTLIIDSLILELFPTDYNGNKLIKI